MKTVAVEGGEVGVKCFVNYLNLITQVFTVPAVVVFCNHDGRFSNIGQTDFVIV